jgi:hypothetical protein
MFEPPQFKCLPVQDCDALTDVIYMTAVPATVILSDKQGNCYRIVLRITSRRFRGAFNNLHFGENVPATGSYEDGNLELRYYQDPGLKAGGENRNHIRPRGKTIFGRVEGRRHKNTAERKRSYCNYTYKKFWVLCVL